jgi:4-diphosphocytidyl-2-C-methyl-D-erythritol kinase
MRVTSFAPAKLNLTLHVGAPQPDGYHPIWSLIAFAAEIGDRVSVVADDDLSLAIDGPFGSPLGGDPDNLVLRAARLLAEEGGVCAAAAITLDKRLPIASGIGGGSTDAAAALRVLNAVWGLNASMADLSRIAARIGSDAPACVAALPAIMSGRGDVTTRVDLAPFFAVMVNPLVPAATPAVYRAYDAIGRFGGADGEGPPAPDALSQFVWLCASAQRNDLTEAAIRVCPEIETVMAALHAQPMGGLVRLSGSGATVIAVHTDPNAAAAQAAMVAARHPLWWVAVSPIGAADVAVATAPP